MQYYARNIGDYAKKAARLSMQQHGIYCLLIDACYDREDFPKSLEDAADWLLIYDESELRDLELILRRFFVFDGEKYFQSRISEELEIYSKKAEIARKNGKKGGRPKTQKKPSGLIIGTDKKANRKLTNNQEPITNNKKIYKKRISDDWFPDDDLISKLMEKHACKRAQIETEVERFRDYCQANDKQYVKFDAAFRNWCKSDYSPLMKPAPKTMLSEKAEDFADEPLSGKGLF